MLYELINLQKIYGQRTVLDLPVRAHEFVRGYLLGGEFRRFHGGPLLWIRYQPLPAGEILAVEQSSEILGPRIGVLGAG